MGYIHHTYTVEPLFNAPLDGRQKYTVNEGHGKKNPRLH
jgi:hypothetical protein